MKKHFKDFSIAISINAIVLYILMSFKITFGLGTFFLTFTASSILILAFILLSERFLVFYSVIPTAITNLALTLLNQWPNFKTYGLLLIMFIIAFTIDDMLKRNTLGKFILDFFIVMFFCAFTNSTNDPKSIVVLIFIAYSLVLCTDCSMWFVFNKNINKCNKKDLNE